MAAILVLDDGRAFRASSLGFDGMLSLIADAIEPRQPKLAKWLRDKGRRPAPFQDFDLRGVNSEDRALFWTGCRNAHANYIERHRVVAEDARSVHLLARLLAEHVAISRGDAPPEVLPLSENVDYEELWEES